MSALHGVASLVCAVLLLASLGFLVLSHRATRRWFARPASAPLPSPAPPVSVLKPVEGARPETLAAFRSYCQLDYPGEVELLFGTLRRDDPVVAVVEQLRREFPQVPIRLEYAELRGANRKTSIMHHLAEAASHELLVIADADVRVPADWLRQVVPPLLDPAVGTVTALPRGIESQTLGARVITLHYAFAYLPQWMAATVTTGVHWAIGTTMAQRRAVLREAGGFLGFADALADDYELGWRASRLGYHTVVLPQLFDRFMPNESLGAAFHRIQRWTRTIRRCRPREFGGVIACHPLPWAACLALLHPTAAWAWGLLVAVAGLRLVLAAQLNRWLRVDDLARAPWLLPVVDLLEWLTFWGAYLRQTITWAGRRYRLRADGTLQPLD
ncbi:MAG: glycosyltransferase [Fimbriimonadaceae bacterium]|nr:glycosyltransferase [Fimbriimonadaceae bacterium]